MGTIYTKRRPGDKLYGCLREWDWMPAMRSLIYKKKKYNAWTREVDYVWIQTCVILTDLKDV